MVLRPTYLESLANRSWIDVDNFLPVGVVERFYIYVHNVTQLDPQSRRIRLQIWRQVDVTLKTYRLVWSQLVQVTPGYPDGALYSVSIMHLNDTIRYDTVYFNVHKMLTCSLLVHHTGQAERLKKTRGQSNLTKSASRLGVTPGGRNLYH